MTSPDASRSPLRILVILPSWVGDVVMATPTLRLLRDAFPGAFLGALARPGIDQLLAGTTLLDEVHVERAQGVMGPKLVAAKLRPRRYDTTLLLPNSLSSALIARIAGIPRRLGYARDARGLLLTRTIDPPRHDGRWALCSAVDYYHNLARHLLLPLSPVRPTPAAAPGEFLPLPPGRFMELDTTPGDEALSDAILAKARVEFGVSGPFALLNPGGNNPAKRWPPDRFALLAAHLTREHGLSILINGSPGESDLVEGIASHAGVPCAPLPRLGITLGALKALSRRARIMVTNDTGPRHIAAALGVPLVSLFGPTDHRWTSIPTRPGAPERILVADPSLPEGEIANDHPDRCRIERVQTEAVIGAVDEALGARA